MPLKIGLVVPRFLYEDMRGGEEAVRTLFNHIDRRNNVSVLTSDTVDVEAQHSFWGKRSKERYMKIEPTRDIFYFKSDPVVSTICHYSYFFAKKISSKMNINPIGVKPLDLLRVYGWGPYIHNLQDHISAGDYDIIHGCIFPTTISYQALRAAKMSNKPFVYTPYYHYLNTEYYESPVLKSIANIATALIACTEQERVALINLGASPSKVFVIPLAFDLACLSKFHLDRHESKQELNLQGKFVILTHPWSSKGAVRLLRALSLLSKKYTNLALLTIGEPDSAYLSEKSRLFGTSKSFTVIDMGWITGEKKWTAFSASDLFSMVSTNDAFGLSYLNAWAFEKPVIGARGTFAESVIKNGVDGILVGEEDSNELSTAIQRMVLESDLCEKMGTEGRERLNWEFHPDRIAREHEHLYEAIS